MNSFTTSNFATNPTSSKQTSIKRLSLLPVFAVLMAFMVATISQAQTTIYFPSATSTPGTTALGQVQWFPNQNYSLNQYVVYGTYLYKVTSAGYSGGAANAPTGAATFTCSGGFSGYTSSYATLTLISSTFSYSGSWVCPSGVYSITIQLWGAGGGGGGCNASYTTVGGAAGGSYVSTTLTVTPGNTYYYTIGQGGAGGDGTTVGGNGGNGGFTYFGLVAQAPGTSVATIDAATTTTMALAVGGAGSIGTTGGASTATWHTGTQSGSNYWYWANAAAATSGNYPSNATASCYGLASVTTLGNQSKKGGNGGNAALYSGGTCSGTGIANSGGVGMQSASILPFEGTTPGGGGGGGDRGNGQTYNPGATGGDGQIAITYTQSSTYAPLPYTTSFENSWTTATGDTSHNDLPDAYWSSGIAGYSSNSGTTVIQPNTNDYWHRSDTIGSRWSSASSSPFGSGVPTYSSLNGATGSYSARFNNSGATAKTQGILDLNLNVPTSSVNGVKLAFDYINPDFNTLKVLVSTDGGNTFSAPIATFSSVGSWTSDTVTLASTSTTMVVRFLANCNSGGTYDFGIDNVSVWTPPVSYINNSSGTSIAGSNLSVPTYGLGSYPGSSNTIYVSGIGLTSNNSLTFSGASDYEFSLDNTNFYSATNFSSHFTFTAPTLAATPVYVRLSNKGAGTYGTSGSGEVLTISGGGAASQTINFYSAVTTTPSISTPTSLSVNNYTHNYQADAVADSFNLTGTYLASTSYFTFSGATDFEFSTSLNGTYSSAANLYSNNTAAFSFSAGSYSQKIYARLKSGLAVNSYSESLAIVSNDGSTNSQNITLSGSVLAQSISTSVSSFAVASAAYGATPTGTSITATAANLTSSSLATVSISGNFVWSLTNGSFSNSTTTLTSQGANFSGQTIYIALASGLPAGYYSGTLTIAGSGITTTVSLSGAVTSTSYLAGNIVALQSISSKVASTSVIEVYPNAYNQTTAVSTTAAPYSGSSYLEVYSSTANTMYLSNSADGSQICFTGAYETTFSNGQQNNTILTRAVATVNNSRTVNIAAQYTGISGNNIVGATTVDNSNYYITDQGGIYTNGSTTPTNAGSYFATKAFGNNVYASTASSIGILPSPTGTFVPFTGVTFSGILDFTLVSSQNNSTYDILYTIGTSGINKYSVSYTGNSGSCTALSNTTSYTGFSICAATSASGVYLYYTTGTGTTTNNSIVKLYDNSSTGNINITSNNTLYTTSVSTMLKGIAFAPLLSQTVSIPSTATYGDANITLPATTTNAGQTITYSITSGSAYASLSSNTLTIIGAGTVTITATAPAFGNYASLNQSYTLVISPKTLTLPSAAAANKVYDATNAATITGTTLSGKVGSDNVTLSTTSGTFASTAVANGISVTYAPMLTGTDASKYTLTVPSGLSANIIPDTLTVTGVVIATKQYNSGSPNDKTATFSSYGSLSGVIAADAGNVTLVTVGATASFATSSPGSGITVTTSGYTISGSAFGNYYLKQPTTTGTITNLTPQSITISLSSTLTYSATTYNLNSYTSSNSGLTSFTYSSDNTAVASISGNTLTLVGAGTANITASQAGNGTYSAASQILTLTVSPATLTITGLSVVSKTYNGTTAATLSGTPAFSGVVGSDVVTIGGTPVATYTSANVANGITVNVTGYTKSGTNAGNYTLTQPTLTGNITQASQTISFGSLPSPIYATTSPFTIASTATSGLTVTYTVISGSAVANVTSSGTVTPVGVGTVTIYANQAGNTNYAAAPQVSQSLTVSSSPTNLLKFDFTLHQDSYGANSADRVSLTVSGTTYNVRTSDIPGVQLDTIAINPVALAAGSNGITYNSATTDTMLRFQPYHTPVNTENAQNFISTSISLPKYKVFSNNALSLITTSYATASGYPKYHVYYQYSADSTTMPSTSTAITTATGNVIAYGKNAGAVSGDILWLATTNTAAPFTVCTTTIPAPSNTTSHILTLQLRLWDSTNAGNWRLMKFNVMSALAQANAILDLPSFTVGSTSLTYNGSAQAPTITAAAGSTSYTGAISYGNYTGTGSYNSATAPTAVGSYSVTVSIASTSTNVAASQTINFTIGKATPTINTVPSATAITYGQTLASSTLSSGSASVAGSFAFTTPSTAPSVGTYSAGYTFTPSDAINYNNVTGSVNVTVNKATPTINAAPSTTTITYGQTLASSTLSGGSASVAGTFAFTTPSTAPFAGTYSAGYTFTPSDATNYNNATGSVNVTVNKISLTITAAANSKNEDGNNTAATVPTITSGSIKSGDVANFIEVYATYTAGTGLTLIPSGSVNDGNGGNNYSYTFVNSSNGVIVSSPYTWLGHTSNWSLGTNWSGGSVPTSTSNVTIGLVTSPNVQPVLTAPSTIHNLLLETGATLSINGQSLTVNDSIAGTGAFIGSATSSLIMNSSYINTLYFTTSDSLANLTLSGSGRVKLGNSIAITNLLSLANSSAILDLNGNGLTMKSNASHTAELSAVAHGATITGGNATVERYVPKGLWEYEDLGTSGIGNAGSIFSNWQESGAKNSTYGIYVTGANTTNLLNATYGLDTAYNKNASLHTFANNAWVDVNNTRTTNLDPFMGYRTFVRGNRTFVLYQTAGATPTSMYTDATMRTNGKFITGDVHYTTSGTTASDVSISGAGLITGAGNWNLIANPYDCRISWTSILAHNASSNITSTYYFYTKTVGGNNTYVTVNANGSCVSSNSNLNGNHPELLVIQPGQSFWIANANSSAPSLTISESDKVVSGTQTSVFKTSTPNNQLSISLQSDSVVLDGALAVFDNNYSNSIESEDSRKLMNSGENIYINQFNTALSIDGLPVPNATDVIELNLSNVKANREYILTVDASQFSTTGLTAYIRDSYSNKESAVTDSIRFTPTTDPVTYTNRFSIVFKPVITPTTVIAPATIKGSVSVYPNPVTGKTFTLQMLNVATGKYSVVIVDNLGKVVSAAVLSHEESTTNETIKISSSLPSGMYRVVVKNAVTAAIYENNIIIK